MGRADVGLNPTKKTGLAERCGTMSNFRGEATNFRGAMSNFRGEATNFRGEATGGTDFPSAHR